MKKYENYCRTLNNLEEIYNYSDPYDNVIRTGLVGLYKVCFEQAWKAMKEILEQQGFAEGRTGSPKQILKTAYAAGMISDENLWLEALQARKNVSHSYNEDIALGIISDTKDKFVEMFKNLKAEMENNWME